MDDEDFDDLLAGVDSLEDSSQESLTFAAANLDFFENSDCDIQAESGTTSPPSSVETLDRVKAEGEVSSADNTRDSKTPPPRDVLPNACSLDHSRSSESTTRYTAPC